MNNQTSLTVDRSFVPKWVWLTAVAWLFAPGVANQITGWIFPHAAPELLGTSPIYYGIFGGLLGLAQWWVMREKIARSFGWVVVTAAALFFAGGLINKNLYPIEP